MARDGTWRRWSVDGQLDLVEMRMSDDLESNARMNNKESLGDMSAEDFRRHGHRVVDWIADYLAHPERYPVLSQNQPGDLKNALPLQTPERGEAMETILA